MSVKFTIVVTDRNDNHHIVAHHQYLTFTDAVNKLDSLRATYAIGLATGSHHAELIINCDAPVPGLEPLDIAPVAAFNREMADKYGDGSEY